MMQLETPRLTIRGFETSDANALFTICSDPEVNRFVGDGKPLTLEQCQKWIEVSNANYLHHNYGAMAVIENSSMNFIGYCGLVFGDDKTTPEIIYGFTKNTWGKGYATEAAQRMLEHGFLTVTLEKVLATAYPENTVSLKILEYKLGFTHTKTQADEDGTIVVHFLLERAAWLKSKPKLVSA